MITVFFIDQKERYLETLSSVHSLQSTFEPKNHTHSAPVSLSDEDQLAAGLNHTHISRLRHTQQLMSVQLEKTELEIQRRLGKINDQRVAIESER